MSEPQIISVAGVQVGFTRLADRFSHWIAVAEAGGWRRLLESCEGVGEALWPPSPPLQELHVEPRGDQHTVALLVGRAGPAHWSLSLELDGREASLERGGRLVYDLACRLGAPAGWLGSSYWLCPEVECRVDGPRLRLVWPMGCALLAALESTGPAPWRRSENMLILDGSAPGPRWPATTRWGFELRAET